MINTLFTLCPKRCYMVDRLKQEESMPRAVNLVGETFGAITVMERMGKDGGGGWTWRCKCVCGESVIRSSSAIKLGQSCGCSRKTHGMTNSGEYKTWAGMKLRCSSPSDPNWHRYGGRGIRVCDRWQQFENFFADMGARPYGATLDRINNDLGYEPDNCRWSSPRDQANNRRTTSKVEYDGETMSVAQWARRFGIPAVTLWKRLRSGVPFEIAIRERNQEQVVAPNGDARTIPEWAKAIGVTRTSAYRMHREGKLVPRLALKWNRGLDRACGVPGKSKPVS